MGNILFDPWHRGMWNDLRPSQDRTYLEFIVVAGSVWMPQSGEPRPKVTVRYLSQPNRVWPAAVAHITPAMEQSVTTAVQTNRFDKCSVEFVEGVKIYIDQPTLITNLYRRLCDYDDETEREVTKCLLGLLRNHLNAEEYYLDITRVPGSEYTARRLVRALLDEDEKRVEAIISEHAHDGFGYHVLRAMQARF